MRNGLSVISRFCVVGMLAVTPAMREIQLLRALLSTIVIGLRALLG